MSNSSDRSRLPISGLGLVALLGWIGLLVALSWWMAQQAYRWLPVQASTAAPLVDGLFSFETGIGTFVFGAVVSVMAWVLLKHRADKYDESDAEPIEGNTRLEVIWTVIPLLLVMAIAVYAMRVNTKLGVLGPMEHIHLANPVEDQGLRRRSLAGRAGGGNCSPVVVGVSLSKRQCFHHRAAFAG